MAAVGEEEPAEVIPDLAVTTTEVIEVQETTGVGKVPDRVDQVIGCALHVATTTLPTVKNVIAAEHKNPPVRGTSLLLVVLAEATIMAATVVHGTGTIIREAVILVHAVAPILETMT